MQEQTQGARYVKLDPEVLAGVSSEDDIRSLRNRLREGGLLREHPGPDVADASGPLGAIARARAAFEILEREDAAAQRAGRGPLPELPVAWRGVVALGLALAGLQLLGPMGLALGLALGALVFFGAPRAPGSEGLALRRRRLAAARLVEAVRAVAGLSFIEAADGVVFECAPHLAFLHRRAADVVAAVRRLEARDEELKRLRQGLVDTNERLGRPAEDEEVAALDGERRRVLRQIAELKRLGVALKGQVERHEELGERLRLLATRRALSHKLGEVLEQPPSDEALRTRAAFEVDLHEIEARFKELSLELSDADAELRAVLEVSAIKRT